MMAPFCVLYMYRPAQKTLDMRCQTKPFRHQLQLKGGEDVGSHLPSSNKPRLLNQIRMSTFLNSTEIGLDWE